MKIKHLFTAVLLAIAGSGMAQEMQMPQLPPIPVDGEVRIGKLPNGLTYYVRKNNYPEKRVNFYIAQRVGSIQEEESQRGLAHFLEHMAFNGGKHFPGNGVIDYTRTLGVEFGGDLNAYTSTDETVYNINDVPSTRQSALDSCLLILADWSNGLLLEDNEIDKERGVIHEEWRLRSSAMQRILERNLETLYPGSKYGRRMPIGTMEVVDGFKYKELRDYYHKWYRTDNQAIIVVGDIDVDYTEGKIKEIFGAIPGPAADAAQVVTVEVPDNDQPIIVVDKDKEQQYSIIQMMYKHDAPTPEEKKTIAYLIERYAVNMICNMLNQRLQEKSLEADCPFTAAGTEDGNYLLSKSKQAFALYALPKPGKNAEALNAIALEAQRAYQHGFTAGEYNRARDEYMSQLEKTYNNRDKVSNEHYGRSYAANFLNNAPIPSIEQEYQIMSQIVPMLPIEAINMGVKELIPQGDKNLVVLNANQESAEVAIPTTDDMAQAVSSARSANVEAYVDNAKDEPLIANLPAPGKIVKETPGKKFGYTELTLSNGAKVILKKTDYKADEVRMRAESLGGQSLYNDKKDYANLGLFDALVAMSGRGEFDFTELQKAMSGKQASANLSMSNTMETVSGNSTIKDLETMFQLTYLTFTDIRKDEKAFGTLVSQLETILKNHDSQPEAVFQDSVNYTLENHSWRERPFKVEDLKSIDYDRVLKIAKERTANAADFTFYFVGNFDNDSIRKYICQYIATLPAKGKKETYKNCVERPKGQVINEFARKMETPKANVRMAWYTYDNQPYNLEKAIQADIAGQVLSKIYLQKIREDAGAAYSAGAGGGLTTYGDMKYNFISASCPFKPEMKDMALGIMRDEIKNATQTIDEGTLKEIKELLLKQQGTYEKENGYWMNVLSHYVGRGIDIQTDYANIVNAQTTATISAFVKNILAKGSHVEVIMLPE